MKWLTVIIYCFTFIVAVALAGAEDDNYLPSVDGMQGIRISCDAQSQHDYVRSSFADTRGIDFLRLSRDVETPIDVLVAVDRLEMFKSTLDREKIRYEVIVDDMGRKLEKELANSVNRFKRRADILDTFPRYDEIQNYLKTLANERSDVIKKFSIGKSFEGRDIEAVRISSGGEDKPAILIDAGIHAREWIAPTTAIYAIKQLVENATNSHLFENVDIYVVPCLNPDGYEYTHKTKETRMWRKTRSINPKSKCQGVDANRNFEYKWNTVGASINPCSDIYAGPEPFSEPETAALRDFVLSTKGIRVYLTLHSYGQYLLHPWGWTSDLPKNEPMLKCVAEKAEARLSAVRGTHYVIGSSTRVLYPAAGGSDDWAYARGNVDLAYTVELPSAAFGFAPPPTEIVPIGLETFEAIKVFIRYAESRKC